MNKEEKYDIIKQEENLVMTEEKERVDFNYRKIIKKLKEKKVYLAVLALFWVYMIFIVYGGIYSNRLDFAETVLENDAETAQVVDKGVSIEHAFICEQNNLKGVDIGYYTYERTNVATIYISVRDVDHDKIIYENEVDCSNIEADETIRYSFETQKDSKDCTYEVKINGIDSSVDNVVSIHTLSLVYSDQKAQTVGATLLLILVVVSFIMTVFIKKADEKTFFIFALVLGVMLIFCNQFPHHIDESTHFFRSFSISNGEWLDSISDDGRIGSYMPDNYEEIVGSTLNIQTFPSHYDIWTQKFSENYVFVENIHMASVLPLNHSVAALGIFIARFIGLPAIGVIVFSRLFPLLFYIICCYFAIKNANKYKSLFFVVALLPTGIWLAASCSQDPVVNGMAILFVSICLKYKFDDKGMMVSKLDMVLILLCAAGIASVKYLVYTPLLLLFFFIPRKKMTPWERRIMIALVIIVVAIFALLQFKLLRMFPFAEWGDDINVKEQIKYMLSSPIKAIRNIVEYCVYNVRGTVSAFSYVADSGVNIVAPLMGVFAVVVAPLLEQNRYEWSKKERKTTTWMFIFIIVVVTLLTTVALYLGFTPVGADGVRGVQARYYLPIIILVMILVSMLPIKNEAKKCDSIVPFICMLGLVDTLVYCINM